MSFGQDVKNTKKSLYVTLQKINMFIIMFAPYLFIIKLYFSVVGSILIILLFLGTSMTIEDIHNTSILVETNAVLT